MSRTYAVGYAGKRITEAELENYGPYKRMSPEFRRRFKGLMDFCQDAGHDLGLGGTWRSGDGQLQGFLGRHHPEDDADYSGDTFYRYILPAARYGKPAGTLIEYWELNPGAAPMAPPGLSYHESVEPDGSCLAVDAIGDVLFADQHAAKFGLRHFGNAAKPEPWHFQPTEIPASRKNYVKALHFPLKVWGATAPPPVVPPPPAPPALPVAPKPSQWLQLPVNLTGPEIFKLQSIMKMFGWYTGKADGWFGQMTERAVRTMQTALRITSDGVYGPQSAAALLKFLIAMQALAAAQK